MLNKFIVPALHYKRYAAFDKASFKGTGTVCRQDQHEHKEGRHKKTPHVSDLTTVLYRYSSRTSEKGRQSPLAAFPELSGQAILAIDRARGSVPLRSGKLIIYFAIITRINKS